MSWREEAERWRAYAPLEPTLREELLHADDLEDRFYRDLAFGTGGLRSLLGAGTNRMNVYTVAKATRGLAAWLRTQAQAPSCAIAYDSRHRSEEFARLTAAVLASEGVRVWLYPTLTPTPMLSFAVRKLGCTGGVVITASHNPAAYNGYKVYQADGCQITQKAAAAVQTEIAAQQVLTPTFPAFQPLCASGAIRWIGPDVEEAYYSAVEQAGPEKPAAALTVVYSPLHGAGNLPVRRALERMGNVRMLVVPEQEKPDGAFPTCPSPNPEAPQAMQLAAALARREHADLFLATDPDCDRIGVGVVTKEGTRLFSGNEMGVMLLDYVCQTRLRSHTMPQRPVAVKTIVTTEMARAVAQSYGVELRNVLTGFKYIGEQIGLLEAAGEADRYVFGFEESYGCLSGSFVRDKDAVNAAVLICEMAAHAKAQGESLVEVWEGMERRYGCFRSCLLPFEFQGESGQARMCALMGTLRREPRRLTAGEAPLSVTDYNREGTGLPRSDVLCLSLAGERSVTVRPSGTEPKLKLYLSASASRAEAAEQKLRELERVCRAFLEKV